MLDTDQAFFGSMAADFAVALLVVSLAHEVREGGSPLGNLTARDGANCATR